MAEGAPARPIFARALHAAAARPSIWLAVAGAELLLALVPAAAWFGWFARTTEHRYAPLSQFRDLSTVFRFDQRQELAALQDGTGQVLAVLGLVAMLCGCFFAGGWLHVFAEGASGRSLARFVAGGARYFGRFLRVMLLGLALLALITWLVHGWPWKEVVLELLLGIPASDAARLETLASETSALWVRWTQAGLYAALVGLLLVWGDYTRTRIVVHEHRSALWAGAAAAIALLVHPVRCLRPMLALLAVEVAVVWTCGQLARGLEPLLEGAALVATLFALVQVALLWRIVLRGARYHAALSVSRGIVRADPWWTPALGPRYPVGGDEFGMSL